MSVVFQEWSFDVKFEGKNVLKLGKERSNCSHCKRDITRRGYLCPVCSTALCDICMGSVRLCPGCKEPIVHSTPSKGPIPIPYPNTGTASDTGKGSKIVKTGR